MPTPDKTNNTSSAVPQQKSKGTFFKPEESFFKQPGEGFFNRSNNTPLGNTDTPFFNPPVQVKTAGDAGNAGGIAPPPAPAVKTDTPAAPVVEKEEDRQKDKPADAGKADPSPDVAQTDAAPAAATVAADPTPAVQPAATMSVTANPAAVNPVVQPEAEPQKDKPVPETTAGKTKAAGAVAGDNNTGGATPPSGGAGAPSGNTNNTSGKAATSITEPAAAQDTPVAKTDTPADVSAAPAVPASPDQDPDFQQLLGNIKTTATGQRQAPEAPKMAGAIDKAASGGVKEVSSLAAKVQVSKISEQEPKPFNEAAFITALLQKIASITPGTLKDADDFKENHRAASLQGDLSRQMATGKAETQAAIQQTANQTPPKEGIHPKEVHKLAPLHPGGKPVLNATGGIPKSRTEAEIEQPATAATKELDDAYEKDHITSEQLQDSNEAEFKDADDQKNKAQKDIPAATAGYRKAESASLTAMGKHTDTMVKTAIDGMHGSRTKNFKGAQGDQEHGKTENEGKRKEINEALERIYNSAKADVNDTLQKLDNYVKSAFDIETKKAQQLFEDYVDTEMTNYKIRRYGTNWMNLVTLGAAGAGTWAYDQMFGMPDNVNTFYQKGKDLYIGHMAKALSGIARVIATVLNAALDRVKKGKQEAEQYVSSLPGDVQKIAKAELKNIKAKFSDLVTTINDKQQSLLEDLAQKYVAKVGELDKQIDEMKKANRGLVDALLEAIGKVIKMIRDLTEKLAAVIQKGMKLISAIIQHPVRFFENLASAVGKGIDKFMSNIMVHLQQGFLSWLMGNLPPGVELPQSMELKDIFKFVMQVLGLTWTNLRAKAVDRLGEKIVSKLEKGADKAFEIFELLKNGNLAAIWDYVKDQLSNLKEMAIDTIQNYLIETIATKGIEQIVKLLNPAGAFIAACEAIYGLIKFIIERGQQILDFVNSVIDSIEMILNGSIDGAAAKVEDSLKKAIPVTLGFLAGLLNIGGLTQKIQELLEKVRQPVMKVIDWIIEKAVAFAQKAYARLMGKQDKKKDEKDHPDNKQKDENAVDEEIGDVEEFDVSGEHHKLWIEVNGGSVKPMVASIPTSVTTKLDEWETAAAGDATKLGLVAAAKQHNTSLTGLAKTAKTELGKFQRKQITAQELKVADDAVEKEEGKLKNVLASLFAAFGETNKDVLWVGKHKVEVPGTTNRESHHVPQNKFMFAVHDYYNILGDNIKKIGLGNAALKDVETLGEKMLVRASTIGTDFKGGYNLPAISLNANTHRLGDDSFHSSALQGEIESDLLDLAQNGTKLVLLKTADGQKTSAQIWTSDFQQYLFFMYQIEDKSETQIRDLVKTDEYKDTIAINKNAQGLVIDIKATKKHDIDAILEHARQDFIEKIQAAVQAGATGQAKEQVTRLQAKINKVARTAFENQLTVALGGVRTALMKNKANGLDGNENLFDVRLSDLEKLSRQIWGSYIVSPL